MAGALLIGLATIPPQLTLELSSATPPTPHPKQGLAGSRPSA